MKITITFFFPRYLRRFVTWWLELAKCQGPRMSSVEGWVPRCIQDFSLSFLGFLNITWYNYSYLCVTLYGNFFFRSLINIISQYFYHDHLLPQRHVRSSNSSVTFKASRCVKRHFFFDPFGHGHPPSRVQPLQEVGQALLLLHGQIRKVKGYWLDDVSWTGAKHMECMGMCEWNDG